MVWTLPIMCRISCKMLLMSYCAAQSSFLLIIKSKASKWRTKPHVVLCRESEEKNQFAHTASTSGHQASTGEYNTNGNICAHIDYIPFCPQNQFFSSVFAFSRARYLTLLPCDEYFLDLFQFIYFSIIIIIPFVIHNLIHFYSIVCRSLNVRQFYTRSGSHLASSSAAAHILWHNTVIYFCFFLCHRAQAHWIMP